MHDENIFSRNLSTFLLLSILIGITYSNSLTASWHFDDIQTILLNPHLHLSDLKPSSLIQSLFASVGQMTYEGDKMYRPIACFTFALNWYVGANNVIGYHIINIVIHTVTAFILFVTILTLFKTPALIDKYKNSQYFIAFLAAVLWSINPIQTQAVTYIVQRMTSLAGLFYIFGMYFYLKGRINKRRFNRILFYGFCILSYLLAVGSKENAAIFPLSILLIEIIFFQNLFLPEARRSIIKISFLIFLMVSLFSLLLFFLFRGDPTDIISKLYEYRPFGPWQRLMTEPRIVVFYISQIFYPIPSRLSLIHDFEVSTSILQPWTTLPAIILISVFILIGFLCIHKNPIISFAILFFFLNHVIESSFLPLELAYEHRNYLPSMFLFFPVAAGLKYLMNYYHYRNKNMYHFIISFIVLLIIGLGSGTYIRNMAWATEKSIWMDVMTKAPGTSRPYQNMADYYKEKGDFKTALSLYEMSLSTTLSAQRPENSKVLSFTNMGNIYQRMGDHKKSLAYFNRALEIFPEDAMALYNSLFPLLSLKMYDNAMKNVNMLLEKNPNFDKYLNLKGYIFLKQNKPDQALPYFQKALRISPGYIIVMINLGVSLSQIGEYERAAWFLHLAKKKAPNDFLIMLLLAENSIKANDKEAANKYMDDLLAMRSVGDLCSFLKTHSADPLATPLAHDIIMPLFAERIEIKTKHLEKDLL